MANPYNRDQPPHYGADAQNPYSNPWGSEGPAQGQPPPQQYNAPSGQSQDHNPFHAQDAQAQPPPHHDTNLFAQEQSYNPPSGSPPGQQYSNNQLASFEATPPGLPPRRAGTTSEVALPQGQDRSHQVEVMQSYESSRPQTEDEENQQILQREFPKIDGSLIAAIYGDSGSLSATREMLQELSSTES
ncbi:hypothetical protein BU23DRAFT_446505 [Bimuria novae-zelandiae CBS 107.79]|uniref:CUE domain-containing protein n=1 Tax=Bimuria novae-zelandiae CBS 107.79 TaxID=1447943 RepID=A0A6A5VSM1_9PLEO|nr:hypothetical protein BU23DRAFT_446505 [Bimuria novae-zelandiae CBS 107.79]